jgi:probable rRNA maturation factor
MSRTEKSASNASRLGSGDAVIDPIWPEPIEVLNRQRMRAIDRAGSALLVRQVLDAIGERSATLNIIFLRDRRMRELNRQWRGIDRPTDVLSFAYHEQEDAGAMLPDDATIGRNLGDLVISVETAERYAAQFGISFEREIEQLLIHGTLHLAGYDHETDTGQMSRLEKRLRQRLLSADGGEISTTRQ